jgi:endoglucanase
VEQADQLADAAEEHAYGRSLRTYYWGINGVIARTTMNLTVANRLAPDERYHDAMVAQVDHLLGRNVYKRSYLTGVGQAPPQAPHHRPSIADGNLAPWPGHLVGGPQPNADDWEDTSSNYTTNEVAINWTTTMIYAVLALH